MKKYRILLVVRWPIGGIRTFFRYVYRNFDFNRYHFALIAPALPETNCLLEDLAELDLRYIPAGKNVSDREFFLSVTRLIRSEDFDLVHSHGFTAGACSILGAFLKRSPHITTLHETLTDGRFVGFKGYLKRWALGAMLLTCNVIQCVSHDARDNLLTHLVILRIFKWKVTVISNGIETERFLTAQVRDLRKELDLPQDSFLIGFLGRYMPEKGFSYLVGALEKVKKEEKLPKRPVLLSFGPEDAFIREEKDNVKKMGLSDSVYFLPFVPDVASTLKGLDVVAMPSLQEACGLLAMEAMVAGVPLIGTNCLGLREVLKGTPTPMVPAKDSLALCEALIMEMRSPTTARAKEFVKEASARFQVKERAAEIEKLMLKFLEG
jgi:glycosyltransferase involved in cell wall biosynthesis